MRPGAFCQDGGRIRPAVAVFGVQWVAASSSSTLLALFTLSDVAEGRRKERSEWAPTKRTGPRLLPLGGFLAEGVLQVLLGEENFAWPKRSLFFNRARDGDDVYLHLNLAVDV